jgi:hypothetical protein
MPSAAKRQTKNLRLLQRAKFTEQGYSRNIQWAIANRIIGQTDGAAVNPATALSQTA